MNQHQSVRALFEITQEEENKSAVPGFKLGTIGARHSFVNHLSPKHGMNSMKAAKMATQN